jgi:hypothetical protein
MVNPSSRSIIAIEGSPLPLALWARTTALYCHVSKYRRFALFYYYLSTVYSRECDVARPELEPVSSHYSRM